MPSKRLKKANSEVTSEVIDKLRGNLQAIVVYGGVSGVKGVEIPEDEMRLEELEMIFEKEYKDWDCTALEKEAKALLARCKVEESKAEVERLQQELARTSDEEQQAEIMRKIMALKRAN